MYTRSLLSRLLMILDGHPAAFRRGEEGQSVMELALVTPLLIMLFVGIVEVGWFANHVLSLQEVTRVGARRGAGLGGDLSPLNWNNDGSFPPLHTQNQVWVNLWIDNWITESEGLDPVFDTAEFNASRNRILDATLNYRDFACAGFAEYQAFYNVVFCTMLQSMSPLTLKTTGNRPFDRGTPRPELDDIVVSVFSIAMINNDNPNNLAQINNPTSDLGILQEALDVRARTFDFAAVGVDRPAGFRPVVIGRYPSNANECNLDADGNLLPLASQERDPFDFITNNTLDNNPDFDTNFKQEFLELFGLDVGNKEYHRGMAWRGLHRVQDPAFSSRTCYGSEFSDQEIEDLLSLTTFSLSETQKAYLPHNGLVMVEMFWRHDLLLQLPVSTQVFNFFGTDSNNIFINVWSAFPARSVEPNIIFGPVGD